MIFKGKNIMNKKYLLVLLSFSILSCSIVTNTNEVKNSNVISLSNNTHTIKVSDKKGANITAKIKIPSSFSIKTNANGSKIAKATDIKSIKVYLLQINTATIAAGSDPLNATNIIYQSTIDVIPTNDITINFTNIGGSTASFGTGNYYHIAIRAFDTIGGAGTELILPNNGSGSAWTGTTLTTPNTAVSLSGIQVLTTNLTVSQVNNLDIILNLKGTVPVLDTYIKITDGSPFRVKSYAVNFCTDPTKPDATKVLINPIIINANTDSMVSSFTHRFELSNLTTAGTYYLTLQAYDNEFNNGTSFVRANNESATAYLAPDANKTIAVSTNSVTLDANLNFTFSSLSYFNVNANLSYFINAIAGTGTASADPTLANGDGGLATSATFNFPYGVAIDSSGNVYISDRSNKKIRKITASGIISTIAGTGTSGATGDGGSATSATLNFPTGVAVDLSGNVYISDTNNNKIRKITASTGFITTIAGTGATGSAGDGGSATSATLNFPRGVALDSSGNVYISDSANHKIRKLN